MHNQSNHAHPKGIAGWRVIKWPQILLKTSVSPCEGDKTMLTKAVQHSFFFIIAILTLKKAQVLKHGLKIKHGQKKKRQGQCRGPIFSVIVYLLPTVVNSPPIEVYVKGPSGNCFIQKGELFTRWFFFFFSSI